MDHSLVILLVVLVSAVVLVLGAVITHLAYRAYRRTGSPVLKLFVAGFALVTLGLLVGGGLQYAFGTSFLVGVLGQRVLTALGFGLLVYSLYVRFPDGRDRER